MTRQIRYKPNLHGMNNIILLQIIFMLITSCASEHEFYKYMNRENEWRCFSLVYQFQICFYGTMTALYFRIIVPGLILCYHDCALYNFLVDFSQMKSQFTRMNFDFTNLQLDILRMKTFSFLNKGVSYSCN